MGVVIVCQSYIGLRTPRWLLIIIMNRDPVIRIGLLHHSNHSHTEHFGWAACTIGCPRCQVQISSVTSVFTVTKLNDIWTWSVWPFPDQSGVLHHDGCSWMGARSSLEACNVFRGCRPIRSLAETDWRSPVVLFCSQGELDVCLHISSTVHLLFPQLSPSPHESGERVRTRFHSQKIILWILLMSTWDCCHFEYFWECHVYWSVVSMFWLCLTT